MSERPIPLCPMGHEMELIQIAAGGWRYVCTRCATSFRAKKSTSCGWLSPIKSTKERAYEAATKRPMQKPLTLEELEQSVWQIPCWVEERDGDLFPEVLDRDSMGYFGRIDAAHDRPIIHYLKFRINETWRCWASHPTDEERAAAAWED